MPRLDGKRAIVTGAGSGIGRASAQLFAAEGARVIAADKTAAVEETAAAIRQAAGGGEVDAGARVGRARKEWGGLDVVYAKAGISGGWPRLFEQSVEEWQ